MLARLYPHAGTTVRSLVRSGAAADDAGTQLAAALTPDPAVLAGLTSVLTSLYVLSYLAGVHSAADQGVDAAVPVGLAAIVAGIDWSNPTLDVGTQAQVQQSAPQGLADLIVEANSALAEIAAAQARQMGDVLTFALANGHTIDTIAYAVEGVATVGYHDEMIASTEAARAQIAGTLDIYDLAGMAEFNWVTEAGACPACLAMVDENPHPFSDVTPPLHPWCLLGSTRIVVPGDEHGGLTPDTSTNGAVSDGRSVSAPTVAVAERDFGRGNVRAVTVRDYEGEILTIVLASGQELTGTPNHPIATPGGWVPLAGLNVGDHVLRSTAPEWEEPTIDPDVDDVPPTFEEIAQSLPVFLGPVPTAPEHFHGDGAGSDVHVVLAHGFLLDDAQPSGSEHGGEAHLGGRDVGQASLDGLRFLNERALRPYGSPGGGVGRLCEGHALVAARLAHPDRHGVPTASDGDPGFQKDPTDRTPADAKGFCQRLLAFASDVAADEIVLIRKGQFAGHVYNLDSQSGYYIGNGILTHNCRCSTTPVPELLADAAEYMHSMGQR